jgi:hypothetical protein
LRRRWRRAILCGVMLRYLRNLSNGRLILWCYFIWYLVVLVRYFDPSPRIWGTSFGLCLIIGVALYVNTAYSGARRIHLGFWQVVRLFMMPLCVSSFSALVKGRGFVLIFSPNPSEVGVAVGICGALCVATVVARRTAPVEGKASGSSPEAPSPA